MLKKRLQITINKYGKNKNVLNIGKLRERNREKIRKKMRGERDRKQKNKKREKQKEEPRKKALLICLKIET